MNWSEAESAIRDAREVVKRGDDAVQRLAKLLVGRLRVAEVSPYVLAELKRELQDFNAATKNWKAKP